MTNFEINTEFFHDILPQFKYIKFLGQGAFAKVYLIEHQKTKKQLAVKKVSCFGLCEYQKQNVLNQVRILSNVNHPNIIKYSSCIYDSHEDNIYILMEFANSGDLLNYINKSQAHIKENLIWRVIADIAQALNYLHKKGIIHRDVKPANILIQDDNFKLADMNISKIVKKNVDMTYTKLGTPLYTSPEMANLSNQRVYNQKCDIWSLGVVIYELCCLKNPFNFQSLNQLTKNPKNNPFQIPLCYSQTLSNIVNQTLQKNPEKRTSIRYILQICQMQGVKLHKQSHSITQFKTIVFPESSQRWINMTSFRKTKQDLSKCLKSNNLMQNGCTSKKVSKQISIINENLLQLTIDWRLMQESSIMSLDKKEVLDEYGLDNFNYSPQNIFKFSNEKQKNKQNSYTLRKQYSNKNSKIIFKSKDNSQSIRMNAHYNYDNSAHLKHQMITSYSKNKQIDHNKFHRSTSRPTKLLKQKQHKQKGKNQRQTPGKYIKLSKQFMKNS